jgi:hypothetical protein
MLTERPETQSSSTVLPRLLLILAALLLPAGKCANASCGLSDRTLSLPIQQELVHATVTEMPVAAFYERCQFLFAWIASVVKTGAATEFGEIAQQLSATQEETDFDRGLLIVACGSLPYSSAGLFSSSYCLS